MTAEARWPSKGEHFPKCNDACDHERGHLLTATVPTGDPNPLYDALKAEVARNWLADQLELEAQDHGWWRRGQLLREARELRGGVL